MRAKKIINSALLLVSMMFLNTNKVLAAPGDSSININLNGELSENTTMFVFMTLLMIMPSIIACFTPFVRYVISLSFLKQSMGIQVPPTIVITGIAIIMTIFTMQPTINKIIDEAYTPYKEETISSTQMLEKTLEISKNFMLEHTDEKYLEAIASFSGYEELPASKKDLDVFVVAPAYLINELTTAFFIGLLFYLIFIPIDKIVAIVLNAMGMVMMPPMTISILIKLIIFVAADGWFNIIKALLSSYA